MHATKHLRLLEATLLEALEAEPCIIPINNKSMPLSLLDHQVKQLINTISDTHLKKLTIIS